MLSGFSGEIGLYSKRGYLLINSEDNTPGLNTFLLTGYLTFKQFIEPS